ncbi:MAG: diaminobutyrate acetyltransferase [Deltaproteobacteria bacterium]|nr:MAG: diaminobutyrate acetyltransferase [Deltaproteobacteria bacterium]
MRTPDPSVAIRTTRPEDGAALWTIVRESGVLDENSCYAYILLCDQFRDTTLIAEIGGEPVGFTTAFRSPLRPDAVFLWQVGVNEAARGRGVAGRLLDRLVRLPAASDASYLETTISPSNTASRRLFESFARRHGADLEESPGYGEGFFPGGGHEAEHHFRIGPLKR